MQKERALAILAVFAMLLAFGCAQAGNDGFQASPAPVVQNMTNSPVGNNTSTPQMLPNVSNGSCVANACEEAPIGGTNGSAQVVAPRMEMLSACKSDGWQTGTTYYLEKDIVFEKASGKAYCLEADAGGITIDCRGHSIKQDAAGSAWTGVFLANSTGWEIVNCTFEGFPTGIDAFGDSQGGLAIAGNRFSKCCNAMDIKNSANAIVENNTIAGCGLGGIVGGEPVSHGIRGYQLRASSISNNRVEATGDGIIIEHSSNSTVARNTVKGCMAGIKLYCGDGNTVSKNIVEGMRFGCINSAPKTAWCENEGNAIEGNEEKSCRQA